MKYEYFLVHDDHQTSLENNQLVFNKMAKDGWRYAGQIARVDSHIIFEREVKTEEK